MASRYRNGGQKQQEERPKGNAPVYAINYWTGSGNFEIACFVNYDDNNRPKYSVTGKKTYKAGDEYKESKSLFHEELPLVAAALLHAFQAIQDIKDGVTRE